MLARGIFRLSCVGPRLAPQAIRVQDAIPASLHTQVLQSSFHDSPTLYLPFSQVFAAVGLAWRAESVAVLRPGLVRGRAVSVVVGGAAAGDTVGTFVPVG